MSVPPAAVQAAATALAKHHRLDPIEDCQDDAVIALEAAAPLIRADERERILRLSRRQPNATTT